MPKPLHLMSRKELEKEATRILAEADARAPRVHDDVSPSWQLSPVSTIGCACGADECDCDACEIASTFADLSGARLAPRFEWLAWRHVESKAAYNRRVREQEPMRAQQWRANEAAARHDPVRGGRIKERERQAKRRQRKRVKAWRELFEEAA